MKIRINNKSGFTLVELIMVIVVLGILAVVAFPQYFNLAGQSNAAAEQGVVGGVRAGIHTFMANSGTHAFPATLDANTNTACGAGAAACFVTVLAQGGITTDTWSKAAGQVYTGPNGGSYTYTPATGSFQ